MKREPIWQTSKFLMNNRNSSISSTMRMAANNNNHGYQDQLKDPPRVLITGALGQLGRGMAKLLRQEYGRENVIMSDLHKPERSVRIASNPYLYVNILGIESLHSIIVDHQIDWVIHFSALLSALGEQNVSQAAKVNIEGVYNVLEVARKHDLKLFIPSSIAAFGPSTPKVKTPNLAVQRPTTIYGVSKLHAELMGEYYHKKFGTDFRSLRLPGIISADTNPGGGTTDYAVKIFHDAIQTGHHECYLKPNTRLPMMYVDDCLRAMFEIMETPDKNFHSRTYNISAMAFTPNELAEEIRKFLPKFKISYKVCQLRQHIAESWPQSIDDSEARKDWRWKEEYNLEAMVQKMLHLLGHKMESHDAVKLSAVE